MKLNLRQIRLVTFAAIFALVAGGFGYWLGSHTINLRFGRKPAVVIQRNLPENKQIDFSLFWDVWDQLEIVYLNKGALDNGKMIYGAIKGLVASLEDPYTVFLPPDENKKAKDDLDGSFEGVGIELGYKDNQLAVISPLKGMPAEKAGVKAGDKILKIEEKETVDISLPEAVELIRGQKGTAVKLTLIHKEAAEPYEVSITRGTIIVPSVEVDFIDDIAHLKLTRFGDRTTDEWHQAVGEIIDRPAKGVVLDLRFNPGGYLSGSVFVASEFLNSGVVVQQESADGHKETYSVDRQGSLARQPLVVLVNEGSASASEIVAGALQYHQRAKVIGTTTFGKGTIQEAQDLVDGSGLHITTARWLLPSGDSIDGTGVTLDIEVDDDPETEADEQLDEAVKILAG